MIDQTVVSITALLSDVLGGGGDTQIESAHCDTKTLRYCVCPWHNVHTVLNIKIRGLLPNRLLMNWECIHYQQAHRPDKTAITISIKPAVQVAG